MGVYTISCLICNQNFQWFSDNADQRCDLCKATGRFLDDGKDVMEKSDAIKKTREIFVYMDGVDFQHEIGEALGGNSVYPNVEDLKEHRKCWESCGIVKCKVTFVEWVTEQNIFKNYKTLKEVESNHDLNMLKLLKERKANLEKLIEYREEKIKNS